MNITDLAALRDKYFARYNSGSLTKSDVLIKFVSLLLKAPNDEAALRLCDQLPAWFQSALSEQLTDMTSSDYYARWYAMEESITTEEIHYRSVRHQELLSRLAPRIRAILEPKDPGA